MCTFASMRVFQHKSGEEAATPGQSTPHTAPSTPHIAPSTPHTAPSTTTTTTAIQYSQQAPPTYPSAPGNQAPQPPLTVHQHYATHYQQHPTATNVPQQAQTRTVPYGIPSGQTVPILPSQAIRPQTTPAQPTTTPLAYSTLNVNVSPLTPRNVLPQQPLPPAVQGSVMPSPAAVGSATGSYQYATAYPPPSAPAAVRAVSPNPALQQQQRSYATGANAYPVGYKSMTSFIGSGSGQAPLTRPGGANTPPPPHLMAPGGGRGAVNSTPLRAPLHPIPHARSVMTPQAVVYPATAGHGVQTPHHPQGNVPTGVHPTPTGVPPTPPGNASGNIGWPR